VLHQIAQRRAADIDAELGSRTLEELTTEAARGPRRREVVGRFARPGLHLIAEIKRSSPSAGSMVDGELDKLKKALGHQ
jgi:indole-3-glycerol phosphate synthase